ncbi:MAG: peptidylprolyl isomerase [Gammaproteobacteria bacterium]|nr:peptidylprolyl isomerase [Gammaproteobacteria bacterium]
MAKIAQNTVVSLDYTLTNDAGETLDKSENGQFVYLHGTNSIIPGLEKALHDKTLNDKFDVTIEADDAYGAKDEAKKQVVGRDMFEADSPIEVGVQFHAQSPEGEMLVITVTDVNGDEITIDGNHPLAGERLHFSVEVKEIRDATEEEIAHGHVHGPDGHNH